MATTSTEQEMGEESSEDDETEEENNTEEPPRPEQTTDQSVVIATPHRTIQELPNLALVALRRLAANSRDDESPDDFRPLKRRRLNTKTEEKESDNIDNDIDEVYTRIGGFIINNYYNYRGNVVLSVLTHGQILEFIV